MPAKRELTMSAIRQMLRLHASGESAVDRAILGAARSTVQDNLKRAKAAGLTWPLPADSPTPSSSSACSPERREAGLRRRPEPDWAALAREVKRPGVTMTILGGVPGSLSRRLRLLALLRPVPRVRAAPVAGHAPASRGRRQGVRRLLGQEGADRRSCHRRGARGRDLRRGARRLEPHLRRGDLEPDACRTGSGRMCGCSASRRRAAPRRAGQPEERHPQGLVLRSRDQPQLRHDGGPLRRRRPAGAPQRKPRDKSQGRGGGALRPDLHPRPSAQPDLLLARRGQRRDRERGGAHQRPPHAPSRRQPARALRERSSGQPCDPAARRLRVRRMAARPRQSRLPRRGRRLPLLRAARPDPRAGRRAPDAAHRRDLPPRPAGRRSQRRHGGRRHGTDPDHMPSSHRRYAEWTPERFRAGPLDRAEHRGAGHRRAGLTAAIPSRASAPASGSCGSSAGSIPARAEAVSARAVAIGALTYKSIASILANNLDRALAPAPRARRSSTTANLRGPRYFH